ncbi:hypothetical protein HY639_02005 [Candidatus Woesearchaeota archaeon]|nr:hypothetical protein [Candidatus Woesearchaeota archaeon]
MPDEKPITALVKYADVQRQLDGAAKDAVTRKELVDILENEFGLPKLLVRHLLKDGVQLTIPYEATNIEQMVSDTYALAHVMKKQPGRIVSMLTLDAPAKDILHEAVGLEAHYRHQLELAGKKETHGKWGGYYGSIAAVSSSACLFMLLPGLEIITAGLVAVVGGTTVGLSVKEAVDKVEAWYNEQHKRCHQKNTHAAEGSKRDEEMKNLQQRLDHYYLSKK